MIKYDVMLIWIQIDKIQNRQVYNFHHFYRQGQSLLLCIYVCWLFEPVKSD